MAGSLITITYDGTDITGSVIFSDASFESQMSAVPGTFDLRVRDTDQSQSFVTGREIVVSLDGVPIYGGFLTSVGRGYAFPAQSVGANPSLYRNRIWQLRGVNYNILFDKRVLRNTADYLHQIPNTTGSPYDGTLIRDGLTQYLDLPPDLDMTTFVDDIYQYTPAAGFPQGFAWKQQGTKWREVMEELVARTGALVYIDASKQLHHNAIDTTVKRWGFSDIPNNGTITGSIGYQGSTIGPREVEAIEDGSFFVNDAFVWGGSQWSGVAGGTVFGRAQNATSIADHNLWQLAETHFGELGYGLQSGVDQRAELIVDGSPGAVGADQNRGLKYAQWQFKLAWFGHEVPILTSHDHIVPGELVVFTMNVFDEGGSGPLVRILPCRSVRLTFPTLDPDGEPYVRFDGFFGLQPDDPYTLWRFLLKAQSLLGTGLSAISTVDNSSTSAPYGAYGAFSPTPLPDGVTTVFLIPFAYITGTTNFYLNGLLQRSGIDYTESDPAIGQYTMATAPHTGDNLYLTVRVAG